MKRAFLLFTCLAVPLLVAAAEVDSPETVLRTFIKAMYEGDKATFTKLTIPCAGADAFLASVKMPEKRKKEFESAFGQLQFQRTEPYMLNGREVKPLAQTGYPNGTKAMFVTGSKVGKRIVAAPGFGTMTFNCIKMTNDWKLDMRWAIEAAKRKRYEENGPEIISQKAIYFQIAKDKTNLAKVTIPTANLQPLLQHARLPNGDMDQILSLCQEMVLVRAYPGETLVMPSGELKMAVATSSGTVFLIGMLGPVEIPVEVRKVSGQWKVAPQNYFDWLHKKNAL
jgi:hypothetical protein